MQTLQRDQALYSRYLLGELFNFLPLQSRLKGFEMLLPDLDKEIISVAAKFSKHLYAERSPSAATYFLEKLTATVESLHRQLPDLIGQSKDAAKKADELVVWLMNRIRLMEYFAKHPFTAEAYLELSKDKIKTHDRSYLKVLNAIPNENLYEQILAWREKAATKHNVMPSMILSEKTAAAIADKLPATLKALGGIKGVGTQKAAQHGAELIGLIRTYQQELLAPGMEQVRLF